MKKTCSKVHSGQEIVEFAVTSTIFLLIVIFIFDVGRVVYYYSVLQNSAREGARYGIIHPGETAKMEAIAIDRAIGLDPADLDVSACRFNQDPVVMACRSDGKAIRVTVEYDFTPITPLAGAFLGLATEADFITLSGQATMRIEE